MSGEAWRILIVAGSTERRAQIRRLLLAGARRRYEFIEVEHEAFGPHRYDDVACVVLDCSAPAANEGLMRRAAHPGLESLPYPLLVLTAGDTEATGEVSRPGTSGYVGESWLNAESLNEAVECEVERYALQRELHEQQRLVLTERKRAEEAIEAKEARFRALAEAMPHFVWETDAAGEALFENARWYAYTGLTHETTRGGGWLNVQHPQDMSRMAKAWQRAVRDLAEYDTETRFREAATGAYRWFRVKGAPVRDVAGQVTGWVGTCTDIDDEKRAAQRDAIEHDVSRILVHAKSVEEAVAEILRAIVDRLGVDCCALWLPEADGRALRCADVAVAEDVPGLQVFLHATRTLSLPSGVGLPGRVWQSCRAIWIEALETDANFPRSASAVAAGLRTAVATPLLGDGRCIGVVEWCTREPRPLDPSLLAAMEGLGAEIGQFILRKQAEEALRASEERLAAIFNQSTAGIAQTDIAGRFVLVNDRYCEITGRSREALLALHMQDITHPEDRPGNMERFRALAEGHGGSFVIEKRYLRPDGTQVWVHNDVSAVRDAEGRVRYLTAVVADVTARREAEEKLRASEEQYRTVFDLSPSGVLLIDPEQGAILDCNEQAARNLGYSRDEFKRLRIADVEALETEEIIAKHLADVAASGGKVFETRQRTKGGELRDVLVNARLVHLHGRPRLLGIWEDITERKRAEEARARLAAIVNSSEDAIVSKDLNGVVTSWNRGAERLFGYDAGEMIGKSILVIIPAERQHEEEVILSRIRRGESIEHYETVRVRKDDVHLHVSLAVSPLTDSQGNVIGASKIARDITGRKRAEANLAFLDELSAAFAPLASSEDIARIAAEKITRHFNATRVNFSDVDASGEAITVFFSQRETGLKDDRITHRLAEYLSASLIAELKTGRTVAVSDVNSDPRTAPFAQAYVQWNIGAMMLAPFISDQRWRFLIVLHKGEPYAWRADEIDLLREVSSRIHIRLERARAEERLRAAHNTFRHLVENSPFGVYAVDADFRLVQVSAGAQKVFENVRPLIGRDFAEVLRIIWPEPFASETIGHFRRTLETGEPYRAPSTVERRQDIGVVESYDWKIERLTLPDGRPGVVCHFYDLSERQRYEAALRAADRQKDEFLAMLAHELRNPLAPIRNAVQIMKMIGPGEARIEQARGMIGRQVEHLTRLVDDLLDISRITQRKITLKQELVELKAIVDAAVETARPRIDERHHQLTITLPGAPLWVRGDAVRLAQVVSNLLINAAKYTEHEHGRIDLKAQTVAGEAEVRVRDEGIGIAPELLPKVFDLFSQADRSLDRSQGGLGIGLSLVKNLIEMHGGHVEAFSAGLNRGSEFVVRLPLAAAPVRSVETAGTRAACIPRKILVVDDNMDAAESMALILQMQGHEVRRCFSGMEALELAADFAPEVLLLDIGLPGMDGYALARRLRAMDATKAALLIALTGYGQPEDRRQSQQAGFDAHLVKPVDLGALEALLASFSDTRLRHEVGG